MTRSPRTPISRRWWAWALRGVVVIVILMVIFDDDSSDTATDTTTVTVAQPAPRTDTTTTAVPAETITDARGAVDDDDYQRALAIAAAVGATEEGAIRRRISNRLARRALSAVHTGNRSSASSLLRQAGRYPTTQQLTQARTSYREAKERAAERASARRLQRRQAAAANRAAEEAAARSNGNCHPNYEGACLDPTSSDYDCEGGSGNGPDYTGLVRVVGGDPYDLDRDDNGVGCD